MTRENGDSMLCPQPRHLEIATPALATNSQFDHVLSLRQIYGTREFLVDIYSRDGMAHCGAERYHVG